MARLINMLAAVVYFTLSGNANAVTIDWVTVGDPGNAPDTTGYGAVPYEYRIGKYEVTIGQYAEFLNAVAATDPYSLYSAPMATNFWIAGIARTGTNGSYSYAVTGPSGATPVGASSPNNRPITYVSWLNAARFANWLHNGKGSGSTETGAYTLNGAREGSANAPARNPDSLFYIPTENEWYKAAYYKGGGPNAGYWDYATQSNSVPGNMLGGGANQANYSNGRASVTQENFLVSRQNYLTDVGAFTDSPSAYGTFDQSGNVYEWNDLDGGTSAYRGRRGGDWSFIPAHMSSEVRHSIETWNSHGDYYIGFRLASPVPVTAMLDLLVSAGAQTQSQLGHPILTGSTPIAKNGAGTLVLDVANTVSSFLTITQGTVVAAHVEAIGTASLNVSEGASLRLSPNLGPLNPLRIEGFGGVDGTVDVGGGRFTVLNQGTSGGFVESLLVAGRNGGTWNGSRGITSSVVESEVASGLIRSIGWTGNADGSVTVAYAAPGDANLDGQVNVFDLVAINSSGTYGAGTASVWSQGDFDYNGVTNIFDMVLANSTGVYGAGNYLPASPTSMSVNAVPEPSLGFVVLGGLLLGGLRLLRRQRDA